VGHLVGGMMTWRVIIITLTLIVLTGSKAYPDHERFLGSVRK